jgi:hypothetical protein
MSENQEQSVVDLRKITGEGMLSRSSAKDQNKFLKKRELPSE